MARSKKIRPRDGETYIDAVERQQLESFPIYPAIPGAAKFRKIPRAELTPAQKIAYSDAITRTILSLQRKAIMRQAPEFKANCASGTFINNGAELHEHLIRARRAELLAAPDKIRRARTDAEVLELYSQAMAAKRAAQATQ